MPEPMRLRHPLRAWWQATPVDRASEPQLLPETAPHGRAPEWRFAAVVIISPQSAGRAGPSNAHDRGGDALGAEATIGNGPRNHVSAAFLGTVAERRVRQRICGKIRHERRRGFAKISARPGGGGGLSPSNGRQWARLGILHRARRRRRVARQRDRRNETHPGLRPFGTSRLYPSRPTAAPRRLKRIPALPSCGFRGAEPGPPKAVGRASNNKRGGGEPPRAKTICCLAGVGDRQPSARLKARPASPRKIPADGPRQGLRR